MSFEAARSELAKSDFWGSRFFFAKEVQAKILRMSKKQKKKGNRLPFLINAFDFDYLSKRQF
ncbi:hypothetical protein [Tumebacillus lipolyticus]|uniref:hypothetical protein n=1 Tax=Tumebacillus lipolyticus TaxID=1280370 RepID=UPI0036DC5F16